jgi:hypothetical protein
MQMGLSAYLIICGHLLIVAALASPVPDAGTSLIPVSEAVIPTGITSKAQAPISMAPTEAADADAISSTVSEMVQSAVTATASVVRDAAQGGREALYDSAPVVQDSLQSNLADFRAQIPAVTQALAARFRELAPLAPQMAPTIMADAPTVGLIAEDALTSLAEFSAAAVPAVAPAMRTTGAAEYHIVAAAAPGLQSGLIRMTPALTGAMNDALTSIQRMPAFASGVTPLFIGGASTARTPSRAPVSRPLN